MQNALSIGSPSRSGVAGAVKSDARIRVLLTGRRTRETAETKVKTTEQQQAQNDSIWEEGELEFNDASYWQTCRVTPHVPACHPLTEES